MSKDIVQVGPLFRGRTSAAGAVAGAVLGAVTGSSVAGAILGGVVGMAVSSFATGERSIADRRSARTGS
jgi:uncharacterized membrane protein